MGHTLTISDEAYEKLQVLARQHGKTMESLIETLADQQVRTDWESPRDPHTDPRYYTFEEFFRHLGVSEERLRRLEQEDEEEDDADL